eukprot:m.46756 g.46756  ORF g.46756 m.46756 type:complete len:594 (-) comp10402_c0_seq2:36-1817(-)
MRDFFLSFLQLLYHIWPRFAQGLFWSLYRWYCRRQQRHHPIARVEGPIGRHVVVSVSMGLDYIIYCYNRGDVVVGEPWMLYGGLLVRIQDPDEDIPKPFAFVSHVWVGESPIRDPYGDVGKLLYIGKMCNRHNLSFFWMDVLCCPQTAKPLKGGGHIIPHHSPISSDHIMEYLSEIGMVIANSKLLLIVDSKDKKSGDESEALDFSKLLEELGKKITHLSKLRGRETLTSMSVLKYLLRQLKNTIKDCENDGFECGGLYCTRMWTFAERATAARLGVPTQMDTEFEVLTACSRGIQKMLYLIKVDILEAIRKEDFHIYTIEEHNAWLLSINETDIIVNRLKAVLSYGVHILATELDERAMKVFGPNKPDGQHLSRWRRSMLYTLLKIAYTHEITSSHDFPYAIMTSMHGLTLEFGKTAKEWYDSMEIEEKVLILQGSTISGCERPPSNLHSSFGKGLLQSWPLEGARATHETVQVAVGKIHFRLVLAAFEDGFWPASYYRSANEPNNEFMILLQRSRSYIGFRIRNSNLCLPGPAKRTAENVPIEVQIETGDGNFYARGKWKICTGMDEANFSRKLSQEPNSTGEDLLAAVMK